MQMPIGKFKGQPVENMDTKYLTWLISNDHIRFKYWGFVLEALKVLRDRFDNFNALVEELREDGQPPEYWKIQKKDLSSPKERAEKLKAIETRRAEDKKLTQIMSGLV